MLLLSQLKPSESALLLRRVGVLLLSRAQAERERIAAEKGGRAATLKSPSRGGAHCC
jgi:hypothetical protein